jgi:hypothetical protein
LVQVDWSAAVAADWSARAVDSLVPVDSSVLDWLAQVCWSVVDWWARAYWLQRAKSASLPGCGSEYGSAWVMQSPSPQRFWL